MTLPNHLTSPAAISLFFLVSLASLARPAIAQERDSLPPVTTLKQLSLEELMTIEVVSVSKRLENLQETASAIQVITAEDIRRSGATNLAEALRLAANLQVAQANSSQWAISARGFNNVLANKLLVLIDGRTVYTPLYAGVFWDVQNPPLEFIERIEVISGPGGALWGANAVNGVINIITRSSKTAGGVAAGGSAGTELLGAGHASAEGRLGSNVFGRGYAHVFGRGSTRDTAGGDADDSWHIGQAGFRLDREGESDVLTLQGDLYEGRPDPDGNSPVAARGANAIARWTRAISTGADFTLQLYFDRTFRDFRNGFTEGLSTYDLDWQHRFQLGFRQEVVWGAGVRIQNHKTENLELFAFLPSPKVLHLYSGFVHDEITLARNHLRLALGSKFEHNDYTGMEIQPSARLAWTPTPSHTLWAAVSRAVRRPARIDRDFVLSLAPGVPFFDTGNMKSEELLAYELGWRGQPAAKWFLSLSTFYNQYDNLRSAEPGPAPFNIPITFANGVEGHSYGVELATVYQPFGWWRLRGGYTFFTKDLEVKPNSDDLNQATAESNDPKHQFVVQSTADVGSRLELDWVLRYVDALSTPFVPSYFALDLRLGVRLGAGLELSVVGQNLLEEDHAEFVPSTPSPRLIERGVYLQLSWR
jgi:iron complex outermembrane receptor protein